MNDVAARPMSRMMIAVDPHKASWTAAAVDNSLQVLSTIRVLVSRGGYRSLRRFASAGAMRAGPSRERPAWARR